MDITPQNTLITVIDMQEKFRPAIEDFGAVAKKVEILVRAAAEMNVAVAVTQQYPKGLGVTVPEIAAGLPPGTRTVEKACFSCFDAPEYAEIVKHEAKKNLVFVGVEAHVCVLMTALDAVTAGHTVWVLTDGIGSRHASDRQSAIDFLRARGVNLVCTESLLFMLLRTSKHPAFKAVQALLK